LSLEYAPASWTAAAIRRSCPASYINVVGGAQSYADVGNFWRWFPSPKDGTANNQAFQGIFSFSCAENTLASRLQREQLLC
jgi:hypothetical protein